MESRQTKIESLAGEGNLTELKRIFDSGYSQLELDVALENAIAYSRIPTAEYLLELGADFSNYDYQGTYYAVHNNEIQGLKFAIERGVDVNIMNGHLLNTAIITVNNTKDPTILKYLLAKGADINLLSKEIMDAFGNSETRVILRNAKQKRM